MPRTVDVNTPVLIRLVALYVLATMASCGQQIGSIAQVIFTALLCTFCAYVGTYMFYCTVYYSGYKIMLLRCE